jgi:hydrogenase maturation protease
MSRVLVGGIGNVLLGDDGFGVEVVRALAAKKPPEGVRIVDFGIRGFDLACALTDGYEVAILVDAMRGGGAPGTLYVIEPDATRPSEAPDGHSLDPARALALARSMGGISGAIRLVGCEPETFGEDDGSMALSPAVAAAVPGAVATIERLIEEALRA